MRGHLILLLHAHLPFVRHPEHEKFLEENWLFEAITETYIPLLQMVQGWQQDGMTAPITLSLSPPLCAMLQDPVLQKRYADHLEGLIALAEKEIHRTEWQPALRDLASMYHHRFLRVRETWFAHDQNLICAFGQLQEEGMIEIATSAATHALLPLLLQHPPSLRAQVLLARDAYRECFGRDPRGIWLPECAYAEGIEQVLQEANLRWFVIDTHGLLHAHPRPRYGVYAPIFLPNGVAAFGRDFESARQVWSKEQGYPGDARYRDFYRDIGFDLDLDYVKQYLPAPEVRGFTGVKYHRITGGAGEKEYYDRGAAVRAADEHATHFLQARVAQINNLGLVLDRPPLVVSPYDAELFGHWWYEGPEFLNFFVRKAYYDQNTFSLITPEMYLRQYSTLQVATPGASSWGEEGYWRVWLNEANQWIYPHLRIAQQRMTEMADSQVKPTAVQLRALNQAARELLLAQSSDWPFILRTGTSPDYATKRLKEHLHRFMALYEQIKSKKINATQLRQWEDRDNIFPKVDYRLWRTEPQKQP